MALGARPGVSWSSLTVVFQTARSAGDRELPPAAGAGAQVLPEHSRIFTGSLDPATIRPLQERVGKSMPGYDVIYASASASAPSSL